MQLPFQDRREGGRALAEALVSTGHPIDLVLALPRGGVPVGYEVARRLHVPLDVFVVRKLGVPGHEELAMGAIASGGSRVLNESVLSMLGIGERAIEQVAARELTELRRRETAYRDGRPAATIQGRHVALVDDGLATGASMRAAIAAVKHLSPLSVTVAVPVAAAETCAELAEEVDSLVCLATPDPFNAVGLWYREFRPTTDDEVRRLLAEAREADGSTAEARQR